MEAATGHARRTAESRRGAGVGLRPARTRAVIRAWVWGEGAGAACGSIRVARRSNGANASASVG